MRLLRVLTGTRGRRGTFADGIYRASRSCRAHSNYTAARQFSTAERDLWMPTVSALAAVGGTPVRADQIQSSWYGAVGATLVFGLQWISVQRPRTGGKVARQMLPGNK